MRNRNLFPMIRKAGKSAIKVLKHSISSETPHFPIHRQPSSMCVFNGRRCKGALWGVFHKDTKFFFLNCYSITAVCLFSPSLHSNPAEPTSLPHLHPPLDFIHVSFIVVPVIPSPHCPLLTPPDHC